MSWEGDMTTADLLALHLQSMKASAVAIGYSATSMDIAARTGDVETSRRLAMIEANKLVDENKNLKAKVEAAEELVEALDKIECETDDSDASGWAHEALEAAREAGLGETS